MKKNTDYPQFDSYESDFDLWGKDLGYYKNNAEINYFATPISVLRYIAELEEEINKLKAE
jgi:hypothetical protein